MAMVWRLPPKRPALLPLGEKLWIVSLRGCGESEPVFVRQSPRQMLLWFVVALSLERAEVDCTSI